MRNKFGIGFIVVSVAAIALIACAYQLSYRKAKERARETRLEEEQEQEQEMKQAVAAEGSALKEDCYYLMEVNGYIVVYLSDKKTPYEYTSILYDELPETVREEVRNGKYIGSIEELYSFLENYSS